MLETCRNAVSSTCSLLPMVDNDANNGWNKATIETRNTIRGKGLLVNINQAVELTSTSTLGGFGVVGKTSTSVIQGVNEYERNPGSKRRAKKKHQLHHQKQHCQ